MVVTKDNVRTTSDLKKEFKDADEVTFHRYFEASVPGTKRWVYNAPVRMSAIGKLMRKRNFCFSLDGITILSNGIVAQCCADYEGKFPIGDMNSETIEQVWNGPKLKTVKDNLRHRRFEGIPMCSNCDLINQNPISRQLTKNVYWLSKHTRIFRLAQRVYAKIGARSTV